MVSACGIGRCGSVKQCVVQSKLPINAVRASTSYSSVCCAAVLFGGYIRRRGVLRGRCGLLRRPFDCLHACRRRPLGGVCCLLGGLRASYRLICGHLSLACPRSRLLGTGEHPIIKLRRLFGAL